jgi:hydroxypyruvate reductase
MSGVAGTERIMEMVRNADIKTLVICLLSGGGSALLVSPLPGIDLEDKQKATEIFLKAGASISEVNAVRKHLSGVKGGRLAQAAYPATVLTLILSDVIGNAFDVIASGPTAPDSTTFRDAAAIIEKYELRRLLPGRVVSLIERGIKGEEPETAKSADAFGRTRNMIVGRSYLPFDAERRPQLRSFPKSLPSFRRSTEVAEFLPEQQCMRKYVDPRKALLVRR